MCVCVCICAGLFSFPSPNGPVLRLSLFLHFFIYFWVEIFTKHLYEVRKQLMAVRSLLSGHRTLVANLAARAFTHRTISPAPRDKNFTYSIYPSPKLSINHPVLARPTDSSTQSKNPSSYSCSPETHASAINLCRRENNYPHIWVIIASYTLQG